MRILVLITMTCLLSCKSAPTRDEIVKSNLEKQLLESMDDPESYEFVELSPVDTIYYIDNINGRKLEWNRTAISAKGDIGMMERYKKDLPSMYSEGKLSIYKNSLKEAESAISKMDSIERVLGDTAKGVASYTYIFKFRGNNKFGAKILSEQIVQTDHELNVIKMTDNRDDMLRYPNGFPGYDDLIKSN